MKKSIFLFFAAILCAMSVQGAASQQFNDQQFLYCIVENTNWKSWGIKYNWYWDSGNWYATENGNKISENHWYAKVPNAYIGGVQFIRCSKDFASEWNWSVTKNSNTRTDNKINCAKITGSNWGDAAVSWTTYAPPMSSVTLSNNGTTINSGSGTQADPYIIEIGTKIKVQASGTKAVDDPDAVINYAFKYGATSQDSETTTWEIDANSPSTTYAIELEGYTKVNTTSSEKKAATKLYYQTVADATLPTYQVTVTANDPAMGTVTGAGEYSEGATAEITATPNAGYRFVNWTDGGTEKSTNATYSFTVTENVTLVANFEELPEETVYFINAGKWSDVYLHLWDGNATGTEWPGSQLTATGEKIGDYDVYSYTAKQGDHLNLLFHENTGDVNKTTDLTWAEGVDKYYIHNYNGNTGWYTQAEAEAILVVPVEYDYVYLINTNDWAKAHIYTWTPEVAGWPGAAMTLEAEQIAGKDVYSYKVVKGTTFGGLNFNCGGDECKTGDLTWQAGKYYAPSKDKWYDTKEAAAEALAPDPLATEVYLAGEMTNWDTNKKEFRKATADATNASVTVTLEAQTYKFKLVVDGAWKGNTGTMQRGGDAVHEGGWSFDKDGYDDNCQIVADIAGDYTFTWNLTSKKLTVTYPELPTYNVAATVNPAETGSVEGAKEYKQGEQATLTAIPAEGYEFVNWTVAGEEVSTEATYSFTVTADVDLVANFVAVDYKDITFTVGKTGFTGVPQIKWWGAKGLEDAAEPVEMTAAGQYGRYSYTFSNIDAITGVSFYIVLDGVQSKTITLHETPNTYSYFYNILQEVFVTLDGEIEGVQLEGHPKAGYSIDYKKVNGVVQLPANTTKAFKLTVDGKDKGGNTIALTKDNLTANFTEDGEGNATIATELAGGYLFTYDYITKDVTVVYPFVGTMDLGQMTPSYENESVTLEDDNYNTVTIYNVVEGEHTYGENFDIEASVKHNGEWYTLTGKGSWTLADGVMTLVTTNLVDENKTVNYTITATALAPQEYTIACNGTYDEEVTEYYSSIKYVGTTNDTTVTIEIASYGGEPNVSGDINGTYFTIIAEYVVEEGEDGVKVLTATAKDQTGNTYHITITATKLVYPTVKIYGATATLDEERTLTLSAEYKGKTVISEIWGYEGAGEYEWVGLVPTDYSFEWSANVVTVTEENGQYTITGVFLDNTDETKYNVTITTKATATALDNLNTTVAPVKMIENGQLIIVKDGVQYNAQGAVVK